MGGLRAADAGESLALAGASADRNDPEKGDKVSHVAFHVLSPFEVRLRKARECARGRPTRQALCVATAMPAGEADKPAAWACSSAW